MQIERTIMVLGFSERLSNARDVAICQKRSMKMNQYDKILYTLVISLAKLSTVAGS